MVLVVLPADQLVTLLVLMFVVVVDVMVVLIFAAAAVVDAVIVVGNCRMLRPRIVWLICRAGP